MLLTMMKCLTLETLENLKYTPTSEDKTCKLEVPVKTD